MRFTLGLGALCALSVLAKPIPPSKNAVPSERSDDVGSKDPDFLKDHDIPKWVHDMAVHPEEWFDEVKPGEVEYYEGLVDKKRSEQAIQDGSDVQAADAEEVVQAEQDIDGVEKAEEREGGNPLDSYHVAGWIFNKAFPHPSIQYWPMGGKSRLAKKDTTDSQGVKAVEQMQGHKLTWRAADGHKCHAKVKKDYLSIHKGKLVSKKNGRNFMSCYKGLEEKAKTDEEFEALWGNTRDHYQEIVGECTRRPENCLIGA